MLFSQTSKHFFGFLVYFFFMATMGESVIDMSGEWFGDWGGGENGRRGDGASFSPQLDDYLPDVYGRLPVLVDADILAVEVADMLQLCET